MADIVIADDEKLYRHLLKNFLESEGHQTRLAENGLEALDLLYSKMPDLLVTDIIMPQKEGLELIIELRKAKRNLKIIAISGGVNSYSGNFCYLDTALKLGADKVILKPFSKQDILGLVHEVL